MMRRIGFSGFQILKFRIITQQVTNSLNLTNSGLEKKSSGRTAKLAMPVQEKSATFCNRCLSHQKLSAEKSASRFFLANCTLETARFRKMMRSKDELGALFH
jgi:late competence protein required for DNA uptake (superfamily II DNA/RNA helicase)